MKPIIKIQVDWIPEQSKVRVTTMTEKDKTEFLTHSLWELADRVSMNINQAIFDAMRGEAAQQEGA